MEGRGLPLIALLAAIGLFSASLLGCSTFGEATAKGAVLGSYEGYLELKDRHPDLGVDKLLENPAFRTAARDLTKAFVVGAGDGYEEAKFQNKADALVRTMLVAAREEGNEAVGQILTEQGPRLQLVIRQTLSTTIRNAGAELRRTAVTDGAAAVRAIMTAAVESLVLELDSERTAAFRMAMGLLTREVGAGLIAGVREELASPAMQVAVAELSKSAAAGARDGLLPKNEQSRAVWTTVLILLGTFFVLSLLALAFYIRRSILAGRALTVIAQQINQDAGKHPSIAEMKRKISERAKRAGVEPHLSAFLKDRGM